MRNKQVKRIRKYILNNTEELLLQIRNELGNTTEKMSARAIYQYTKRLWNEGKLKLQ